MDDIENDDEGEIDIELNYNGLELGIEETPSNRRKTSYTVLRRRGQRKNANKLVIATSTKDQRKLRNWKEYIILVDQ